MRSRQTGHVGSSTSEGVRGGIGFVVNDTVGKDPVDGREVVGASLLFASEKLPSVGMFAAWISIDLTKTTW